MAQASRDQNFVTTLLAVSSVDGVTPVTLYANPTTHRLLVDLAGGGSGTVQTIAIATANGFAGSSDGDPNNPTLTLSTTVTGILKGNGTAVSAVTIGSGLSFDGTTLSATGTGSPGGSNTQVQYNNSGAFAGITGATTNGTTLTLVAPVLGTPASGTLTNCTGYTVGNISGLGTGVATALAVNVGSAGAFVTFNGALGTPSSGTVTNLTGTASININGTVGATTPTTATFTTATINTVLNPDTDGGAGLGSATLGFSILGLSSGSTINFANSNVVLTHSSGILTVSTGDLRVTSAGTNTASVVTVGGAQTLTSKVLTSATITTGLTPTTNDGAALGSTSNQFSDLFLAEGGVINWDNGDATLTQVGDVVTLAGADLKVSSPGNVANSVVTTDGTQTLTNKTLTSPTLTTPSAFTTGGTITLAENTTIALDPAGSADGKYTGITVTGTAGYTQAFGDLVYLDPTDSRWEAADANSASGADGDARGILGMVVSAGTDGNACTILLVGIIRADAKFPSFTVNNPIYVSETAGSVTQTQPTTTDVVIRVVGAALTADEMYFNPDFAYITHT